MNVFGIMKTINFILTFAYICVSSIMPLHNTEYGRYYVEEVLLLLYIYSVPFLLFYINRIEILSTEFNLYHSALILK